MSFWVSAPLVPTGTLTWCADFGNANRFGIPNGDPSTAGHASLNSNGNAVPVTGTLAELVWSSQSADATTVMKIFEGGPVGTLLETVTLSGSTGNAVLSAAVIIGQSLWLEFDAGTTPGESQWRVTIQPAV
ncbi:hypothetical protein LCGC14_0798600 [marine sediment metagenome]|uniref:Bulb-type lectin domain-containing protein n=1 Tax=marine sediment metagenome TaxID=412755 RepID=A0A0F9QA59_9ZZZZ